MMKHRMTEPSIMDPVFGVQMYEQLWATELKPSGLETKVTGGFITEAELNKHFPFDGKYIPFDNINVKILEI